MMRLTNYTHSKRIPMNICGHVFTVNIRTDMYENTVSTVIIYRIASESTVFPHLAVKIHQETTEWNND